MRDLTATSSFSHAPHQGRGKKHSPSIKDWLLRRLEYAVFPLALITGVLAVIYWHWTTTPQYALAAVIMSVNNHDTQMFEKYVDVDTIVGRALDEIFDGPACKLLLGKYDQMIGAGFLRFFKNDIIGIAHERSIDFVTDNKSSINIGAAGWLIAPYATLVSEQRLPLDAAQAASAPTSYLLKESPEDASSITGDATSQNYWRKNAQLKDLGFSKEGFRGYSFKQDGPVAILTLQFRSVKYNQDWLAHVKFEDAGGYWRVTEIANLHELIAKYVDFKSKRLL